MNQLFKIIAGLIILVIFIQFTNSFFLVASAASDNSETRPITDRNIFSLIAEFFQNIINSILSKPSESLTPIVTPITQPSITEPIPPLKPGQPITKNVAVTARGVENTIIATLQGGTDYQTLSSLTIIATAPSGKIVNSRFSSPKLGQDMTITSPGTGIIHFVVTGQFTDGIQQVVLDTFIPIQNPTTKPITTVPPKIKNVVVTAIWVGNDIIATLQGGTDYQSLSSLTLIATAPSGQIASSTIVFPLLGQDMTITSPGTGNIHFVVTGQFSDGVQQVVLDTFIPISSPTTISTTAVPPKIKNVAVTALQIGDAIFITGQGGPDFSSVTAFEISVNGVEVIENSPILGQEFNVGQGTQSPDHLIVIAAFNDGTKQVVLDTYV
ncbi:MAG: hypothetical protein LUO93_08150 [Methanomicrobiales archaeon]|nr:hypothetical protein [Methanomicrobiales archaeon]